MVSRNMRKDVEGGVVQDITERKQAEEALRKSEQLYRSLFENMLNGFAYCKMLFEDGKPRDFVYLGVNSAFETLTGLKNVVGKNVSEVIPGIRESDPQLFETYGRVALTGVPERFETFVEALNMWFSISVYSPQTEYFVAVFDVITDRKKAEEALKASEEKYRTMVENLPVGIMVNTIDGRSPERNKTYMEMHGYTSREEFNKIPAVELYFNPEDRKRFLSKLEKGMVRNFEIRHKRKDGSPFWVSLSAIPQIGEHGEKLSLNICQDIDERKRAEEALRESEEKFRNLAEYAPVGIAITLPNGSPIVRNAFNQKMHGYDSKEQFMKVNSKDLYYDITDRERWLKVLEKGPVKDFEVQHKRKDNSAFWASLTAIPYTTDLGEQQFILITQDITERKQAEESLKESEKKYSTLVEQSNDGIIIICDSLLAFANTRILQMTGFSLEKTLGKPFIDFVAPADRRTVIERYQRRMRGKIVQSNYEISLIAKSGKMVPVEISASLIDYKGKAADMAIIRDITERKKAEEALKASEEKYRNLVENASIGIFVITAEGKTLHRNHILTKMYGYDSSDEFKKVPAEKLYHDPKDGELFLELIRKGPVKDFESKRVRKDGSIFWTSQSSLRQISTAEEEQFIVVMQDITERKGAEEALRASEERFRSLVDNAPVGIGITTLDGRSLFRNKAIVQMYGYDSLQELMSDAVTPRYYDPEGRKRFLELASKGLVKDFETQMKRKDGTPFWISLTAIPWISETGEKQFITVAQDIDERKKAESGLKHAAEEWRTTFDSISDPISIQDKDCRIIRANKAYANIFKMKPKEIIGKTCYELVHHTREPVLNCPHRNTLGTGKPSTIELLDAKTGKYTEVSTSPIIGEKGEISGTVHIIKDITERKQAEEALKESEEKYRSMVDNLPVGVTLNTIDGRSPERNRAFMEMHGYTSKEEFNKITAVELYFDPEDRKRFLSKLEKGAVRNLEVKHKRKDGSPFWISLSAIPQTGEHNEKLNLVICQDIDESKRAENEIRESLNRLQKAMVGTIQAMAATSEVRDPYNAGHQRRVSQIARGIASIMKLPEEQVTGLVMAATVHDIGKIGIPAEILSKPGKINEMEFNIIKTHVKTGYDILKNIEFPWPIADIVSQHHERMDGSGYPNGVKDRAILLEAKILAVADVVEAMASHRPYRAALGIDKALEEIVDKKGILYDADVVNACLKLFEQGSFKLE